MRFCRWLGDRRYRDLGEERGGGGGGGGGRGGGGGGGGGGGDGNGGREEKTRSVCTPSVNGLGDTGPDGKVGRKIAVPSVGIYSKCSSSLVGGCRSEGKGGKCIHAFLFYLYRVIGAQAELICR